MIRGHTRGDNRLCMRHLYSNFRKKFPSLELKNRMWQCAKATHWRDWEKEMKSLRLERTQYDDVMPPPYRRPSHIPVKKRKRGSGDEENRSQNHLSQRGQIQRCSNCGDVGHKKGAAQNLIRVYVPLCSRVYLSLCYAQISTQQAAKAPKRWRKASSSQLPGQIRKTSSSQPNPPATQPKKLASKPKKSAAQPKNATTQSNNQF
ncbi:hypothetical protein Ahy_B02g057198 [Arachis hypogaea]|uniref:Uncharacterized protein n=1 Tax=Arachis hypogaea TaxID=3818 RepID=A0A445AB70_ARAHY|nr:hypothetical protein Ahy_B02g057198 [Arachis hypogaea]